MLLTISFFVAGCKSFTYYLRDLFKVRSAFIVVNSLVFWSVWIAERYRTCL